LRDFSVNELQSLHALVISAMNRRPGDTQNVAIGVFNDWFEGRNTDYPGKLWSVWGIKTTAYMRTQEPARIPKGPRDAIDDEALRTGQPVGRFVAGAYRYSLPIVFGVTPGADGQNCVMCHGRLMGEKKGDVIAVFSSSISTSADLAALQRFLLLLMGGAILVAAVAMAGIWAVFERLVSQPLTVVTGAMTALARGKPNVTISQIDRTDEVGRLAAAFETLKNAEAERRRLADAFKDANVGLAIIDADSAVILAANPAFAAMYGMSTVEIIGTRIDDFACRDLSESHGSSEQLPEVGRSGVQDTSEWLIRRKDGSTIRAMITIGRVSNPEGSKPYRIASQIDITESRDAEERIRHLEKMEAVGELTGGIAHDFNNVLAAIVMSLELAQKQVGLPPKVPQLIDNALSAASSGAQLTHRLLAFARRQPLRTELLDINQIVSGLADLLRHTFRSNIDIEINLSPDIWPVAADRAQIESALLNLAINARDAMLGSGKLTITTINRQITGSFTVTASDARSGDYVVLTIADTGIGMAPEVLRRVLEPFFTTKPLGKGTGLGLSMVYGFIKQSGGFMTIQSQPQQGTAVSLYFPRSSDTQANAMETSDDRSPARGSETILVVDDNASVRTAAIALLENLGYRTLAAEDAAEAMQVLADRNDIDVLFTDIMMPGEWNGAELAEAVALRSPALKILLTSGVTDVMQQIDLLRSVPWNLLPKPYRQVDLAHALRELLDHD
jgi:PAS domain S-box-containing protein